MLKFFLVMTTFLSSLSCFGYAENVTHGYPSCIACHASPTGGNMLTDYGRSLSKELMSTWGGWKNSEQPLWGAFKNPKGIRLGGDFRRIQTYVDNAAVSQGKSFNMQSNIEVGIPVGKVLLVGALGVQEGPEGVPGRGEFLSERHYLLWETSSTSRLRVGKFRQRFGLNDPNHTRRVKSLFGFGSQSETYNIEYTQIYETFEIAVHSSLGRIDQPRRNGERNVSMSFAHYLDGKSQLGGSLLFGESTQKRRTLAGVFGVLPLSEHLLTLFELDYESAHLVSNTSDEVKTFASQTRLAYQLFKGFLPYLVVELSSEDSSASNSFTHSPGLGVQWFPFPHVELHLEYQRGVNQKAPGQANQVGWVQLHLYPF